MPPKREPGTSFYPIVYTNDQAIFQIRPSSLDKTWGQDAKSPMVLRSLGSDEMCPAGRSSPKIYQTRPAWASFVRTTAVTRHGTATWTWLHSPREKTALEFRRNRMHILLPSTGGTETVVRVTVRRGVPVTVRRADVRRLIPLRLAPKRTRVRSSLTGESLGLDPGLNFVLHSGTIVLDVSTGW